MHFARNIPRTLKALCALLIACAAIPAWAAASDAPLDGGANVSSRLRTGNLYAGVGRFTPEIGDWMLESGLYFKLGYEIRHGKESFVLEALYSEGGYKTNLTASSYTHTSFQAAFKRKIIREKVSLGMGVQTRRFGFDNDNKFTVWGPVTLLEYHISKKRTIRIQNAWAIRTRMNNRLHAAWCFGVDQEL